ncbi:DNA topoisomerase 3 [Vagococcus humatus]|uniref:DNA topoisomerase n=1 Tax=Vagococcus humatus TaxID=1889241 RepID=A0A429Z551_9ENTE|nr:DNA topoisomerase 3 [Vagococcus humatus]RST88817.1 DNA topoisomerase III [Vagococcus humatus]
MKQLVIAEKPSVAKDLAQVLGASTKHKNYYEGPQVVVTWALGHLLGLKMPEDYTKKWQKWEMETLPMIPKSFGIKPLPKTNHQLKTIKQLANRQDIQSAVIATDAGREGELVARWILEFVGFKKPVKRLWISSQTDKAIREGFKHLRPSKEYDDLYESALARAKADWLVGLNVTRALTVKYQDNLSAGRVQTPTLALVRKQEEKIEKFRPSTYYVLSLTKEGLTGEMVVNQPISNHEQADKLLKQLQVGKSIVSRVEGTAKKEQAPLPYDLTELQRVANQKYGYSAKKTLSLVQSLYEFHKIVSYPRTDSKYLTTDMKSTMKERLDAVRDIYPEVSKQIMRNGAKVTRSGVFQNSKVTDHHALLPTEQAPRFDKLTTDEQRIYFLIVDRFLGLFLEPYQYKVENIWVQNGKQTFKFQQKQVTELGFKKLTEKREQGAKVTFEVGQTISGNYTSEKRLTQPPKPLTEASLLGKMEHHQLGTPATRAEIIEKLIQTELMTRNGNYLGVSPKGKQLLQLVNPSLVSPALTAKWEQELEDISKGKKQGSQFIKEIEAATKNLVKEIKMSEETYVDFALTQKKCPECGAFLKEKTTRQGKIYQCSNTECTYHRRKDPKLSNHRCPQCHKKMEILEGKNGAFFKCKYCSITEKIPDKKERKKKMTKHEERRLVKKYSQEATPEESPLALALKAAMKEE